MFNDHSNLFKKLKIHWDLCNLDNLSLKFYGITKDPETKEFMMIIQFANKGNLRHILSSNFNNILWKNKIKFLSDMSYDLKNLHKLGCFHKDFHSGNKLQIDNSIDIDSY